MADDFTNLKRLRSDYAATFKSPRSRRVLRDLMQRFNVSRPHLTSNPNELFRLEGQRSVVLHIFTMLRLSETDIDRLMSRQPAMFDDEEDFL